LVLIKGVTLVSYLILMTRRHFLPAAVSLFAAPKLLAEAEMEADIAIIGGSVGGCAAALAALRRGLRVILSEETAWIGGQLTNQAVPPDEHPWIEMFGCTRSYRNYRNAVREYYRTHYKLTAEARARVELNPGNGTVSRLTHEPRVSLAVLEAMLAPYVKSGTLKLLLEHAPVSAASNGDRVASVTLRDLRENVKRTLTAKYFLDATETGELLPLTHTEFVTGAEARTETLELHAQRQATPSGNQSFTFCFAIDHLEGEDHTIEKPRDYNRWRSYVPALDPPWTGPLLSWEMCDPKTLGKRAAYFEPNPIGVAKPGLNLWTYRRILARENCEPGVYASDISLVNWPQNDYWLGDLLTATPEQTQEFLRQGRELSLSLLYWMQTEAPRPDGKQGWKGLRLRKDVVGTEDGLAKAAYIRESRRIKAEFTILEQHVGTDMRASLENGDSAAHFEDSVGIGCYRIDLHPAVGGTNYIDVSSLPFQIPLGALLPLRVENLLPACKNIGTTHITNGCYRLHPVEWNIGEGAGALAAQAILTQQTPRAMRANKKLLADFQASLREQGFELEWPRIHAV
jgi:hypothetical protein